MFETHITVGKENKVVTAHDIFHAVMTACETLGLPKNYRTDLAHDAHCIYENHENLLGLVYCVRDSGTHIFPFILKDEKSRAESLVALESVNKIFQDSSNVWLILCDPTIEPLTVEGTYTSSKVSFKKVTFDEARDHMKNADIHTKISPVL